MEFLCVFIVPVFALRLFLHYSENKIERLSLSLLFQYCFFLIVVNAVTILFMVYVFKADASVGFNLVRTIKYLALSLAVSVVTGICAGALSQRFSISSGIDWIDEDNKNDKK